MKKITTPEMEVALAKHFNPRVNLVVPNVSWGFMGHEADLFVMTKSGYAYEVEIKISLSDLKADMKKAHGHHSKKIKYLYFAIPEYLLEKGMPHIPDRAGILVVYNAIKRWEHPVTGEWHETDFGLKVREERKPVATGKSKLSAAEQYQIARLGALRVWGLKGKIIGLRKTIKELKETE